jgi:hypothetical protein
MWIPLAIGLAVALTFGIFFATRSSGSPGNSFGDSQQDFTSSDLQKVASAVFPGWTITPSTAQPILDTTVTAIAFARDAAKSHGMAGVYIYESRGGTHATGESDARAQWKANAEAEFGVRYRWLTCRNAMFLEPEEINDWAASNMRRVGC